MKSYIDLNVVLLPNEKTAKKIISLSQNLSKNYRTSFILNKKDKLPHLSLYQSRYPKKAYNKILNSIENISKETRPFTIFPNNFSTLGNYLFYDAIKQKDLINLHKKLVSKLNKLRKEILHPNVKQFLKEGSLTKSQAKNAIKYGNPLTMEGFIPHITITKFANPNKIKEAAKLIPKEKLNFKVTELALAPIGKYGSCSKIIKRFHFVTKNN